MRARLKRFTLYLKERRKPLLVAVVPFSLFGFVFLLAPDFTFAGWPADQISDAIGDYVTGTVLGAAKACFSAGVWIVNVSISFTANFLNDPDKTLQSWQKIRDTSLGLFGIAILLIAFMNLLRLQIQVWSVSRLIPKLFLAIFLVIFSKFICISIINFATSIANTFTQSLIFDNFNNLVSVDSPGMKLFSDTANTSLSTALAVLIFSVISFFVLLLLGVILFFRSVVLALLIVISPLAFAMTVLPWTAKYFQEWWKYFLKWTFFFPICIIILSIGFTLIPRQPNETKPLTAEQAQYCDTKATPPRIVNCIPPTEYSLDALEKGSAASSFFGMMASLGVGLTAIVLSVFLPLKMLGAFGAVAGDIMSGKKGIPGSPISPKVLRDWGSERGKKVAQRRADRFTRAMRRPFAGNNRVATFITGEDAMDRTAIRDEKANMVKKNLTVDQQRLLAQNNGDVNALRGTPHQLSDRQEQWYGAFESRGGSHEDISRNLANNGDLNHDTLINPATGQFNNVGQYLQDNMDLDASLKKSNLDYLRNNRNQNLNNVPPTRLAASVPYIQHYTGAQMVGIDNSTIQKMAGSEDASAKGWALSLRDEAVARLRTGGLTVQEQQDYTRIINEVNYHAQP